MVFSKLTIKIFFILSIVIFFDQLTKYFAYIYLFKNQKIIFINELLNLRPVWNDGISFGMLQGFGFFGRVVFIIIAFSISLWLIFSSIKQNKYGFFSYNLIAGGALGNVIDRVYYGKVIDFIDFHINEYHWPTFNLADSFIFLGVLIFILSEFILFKRKNIND